MSWNKMWDMWVEGETTSPYTELMSYQSEVNNGGHSQYFFNIGENGDLKTEMAALETVLSPTLKANLRKAYEAYLILEENEEDEASEEALEQCDDVFYEYEEEINRTLEAYAATIEP